jgi:DNA mismatch endonuclease (patch repair protein)
MVFSRYRSVILVNGCFWHGHDCHLGRPVPRTRSEFWKEKISSNRLRDLRTLKALMNDGWRVAIVWECAVRGRGKMDVAHLSSRLSEWLVGTNTSEIHFTAVAMEN